MLLDSVRPRSSIFVVVWVTTRERVQNIGLLPRTLGHHETLGEKSSNSEWSFFLGSRVVLLVSFHQETLFVMTQKNRFVLCPSGRGCDSCWSYQRRWHVHARHWHWRQLQIVVSYWIQPQWHDTLWCVCGVCECAGVRERYTQRYAT